MASTITRKYGIVVTPRDIINHQAQQRDEEAGDLTPTQRFLQELRDTPGIFHELHRDEKTECIETWRRNPEVWSMDCTYKVNRFDMPLLQINGVTNLHTTFSIAYCLLSGEKEASFQWVLDQVTTILTTYNIERPQAILTDFDKALKNALGNSFNNDCQHQICMWHIMKNVCHNVKKKWGGSLEGTALGEAGSGDGSHLHHDVDDDVENSFINPASFNRVTKRVAERLLDDDDRDQHRNGAPSGQSHTNLYGRAPADTQRRWLYTADGILAAWKATVYSNTEEAFLEQWETLKTEFAGQPGKLFTLLYHTFTNKRILRYRQLPPHNLPLVSPRVCTFLYSTTPKFWYSDD
jgi:hypothetical protein